MRGYLISQSQDMILLKQVFLVLKPVLSNKRFIHSPAEKKTRTLRSSAGRVRKLDCGILVRDY